MAAESTGCTALHGPDAALQPLLQVQLALRQWALEGPPRNPRAAAGSLANELEATAASLTAATRAVQAKEDDSGERPANVEKEAAAEEEAKWAAEKADLQQQKTQAQQAEAKMKAELKAALDELRLVHVHSKASTEAEDLKQQTITKLQRRVTALSAHLTSVLAPVSAVCRARPLNSYDAPEGDVGGAAGLSSDGAEITVEDVAGRTRKFKIDRVLDGSTTQEDLFETAAPWVENAALGGSSCVFAYGATGAGKTHSILGEGGGRKCPGLAHFALNRLLEGGCSLSISMLEVYCEQIRDLLASGEASGPPTLQCSRRDGQGRLMLDSAEVTVSCVNDASDLLQRGFAHRATEGTLCNESSSRSHVILTMQVTGRVRGGRLVLVDLAGSENVQRSGADEGGKLLAEAKAINRSLSALADVVEATAKQQTFVPYRNSRLTMLLEEPLSSSRVLLLVHVSPLTRDATDTAHSLAFASRVRAVDFAAQRLRQDQEDRAKAATQRCQLELRQIQAQLDSTKKELAESQRAQVELKQQVAHLSEQLRERQRELVREQELRCKAEEAAREQRYNGAPGTAQLSSSHGQLSSTDTSGGSSRLLTPKSRRGAATPVLRRLRAAEPQEREREGLTAATAAPLTRCHNSWAAQIGGGTGGTLEAIPGDLPWRPGRSEAPLPTAPARQPLGDRTNSDNSLRPEKNLIMEIKPLKTFSPLKARLCPVAAEEVRDPETPRNENLPAASPEVRKSRWDMADGWSLAEQLRSPRSPRPDKGLGVTSPRAEPTSPGQPNDDARQKRSAELRACLRDQVLSEARQPRYNEYHGQQVRSVLRRTPSDFRNRSLRAAEGTGAPNRHVQFVEEKPEPFSPPRWYMELVEHERALRSLHHEPLRGGNSTPRLPTPPSKRRSHEAPERESRETAEQSSLPRWR